MYLAVEIAIFVACVAIVCFVPVAIFTLFRIHQATERLLCLVEQLRQESKTLISGINATVEKVRALAQLAEDQWFEVEKIIGIARDWAQRADHVVDEIGSIVEPPLSAVSRRASLARIGFKAFLQTLRSRSREEENRRGENV
jgi:hypothetical protein